MKTQTLRTLVLVGYGLAVSLCVLPALVSPGMRFRGASSGQWEGVLQAWASRGLYLPWRAMTDEAHDPHALIWLSIFVALAGMGMGLLGAFSPRVLWGGPPASGQGQHGTARWRTVWELQRSLARWSPQMATPPNGLVVGQGRHDSAWVVDQEGHALVVGATQWEGPPDSSGFCIRPLFAPKMPQNGKNPRTCHHDVTKRIRSRANGIDTIDGNRTQVGSWSNAKARG